MQFWRPGDPKGPSDRHHAQNRDDATSQNSLEAKRLQFLYAVEQNQVVCIHVDPEYDAVTALPRSLAATGWSCPGKCIAVALPRQVGVLGAALRLVRRYGLDESQLGGEHVGYAIPGNARRSTETKVVYYACDTLIDAIRSDPLLNFVSVVFIDEMKERCISTDLLVALLRQIQRVRSDLRIILCGTAFNIAEAQEFFCDRKTARIQISGYKYAVSTMYLREPVADYMTAALETVKDCFEQWNRAERPFDRNVLVFVSGADETDRLCQDITDWFTTDVLPMLRLRKKVSYGKSRGSSPLVHAVPLHASLDRLQHAEATQSDRTHPHLKVVVATNLAEAAVVVEGVSTVIDCGFEKVHVYDAQMKTSSLAVVPISQASARQRATQAGRTGAGVCFRLYTQSFFENEMSQHRPPEILRHELSKTVVMLKALGIDSIGSFQFMTQPPLELFTDALDRLYHLGAVDSKGALTADLGIRLIDTRLSPHVMRCIALGEEYGVGRAMAGIAAMLEVRHSVFNTRTKWNKSRSPFAVAEGDLLTLLNVWRRYNASGQSNKWCKEQGIDIGSMRKARQYFEYVTRKVLKRQTQEERFAAGRKAIGLTTAECVRRCIAGGFFENACMVQPDGSYLMATSGRRVWIHSSSVLRGRMPKWLVFTDVVHSGEQLHVRDVTVVEPRWMVDAAPGLYELLSGEEDPRQ